MNNDLKVNAWDSIPVRLGLGVLIISLATLVFTLLIVVRQEERYFTEAHRSAAYQMAIVTAADLGDEMMAGGGAAVWRAVSAKTVQRARVSGATRLLVVNKDGIVKAGSESALTGTRVATSANSGCPACDSTRPQDFPASTIVTAAPGRRQLRVVNLIPFTPVCRACHIDAEEVRSYLSIDFDLSDLDLSVRQRRLSILGMGLVSGVAMFLLIALLFRRLVMRPVNALMRSVQGLAGGNLGERTVVQGHNELALLARDFNHMAARIEEQLAQIKAARSESELLYSFVVGASVKLEMSEFATGVARVIVDKLYASRTAFFLEAADEGWLCATAGTQQDEPLTRGEGSLEAALLSNAAQVQQLLGGLPLQFVRDACSTRKPQFSSSGGEMSLVIPVFSEARLVGMLVCTGITPKLHMVAELIESWAFHLTLAVANSRNYTGAITDALTRLKNKQYGLARLAEAVFAAQRYKSGLGLAMCDIDHFKQVNDRYGHLAGDVVLKEVCRRIAACVRKADIAVRFGGEEFMLILPETDANSLQVIGENVRRVVAATPVGLGVVDDAVAITVSVGMAAFHAGADTADSLIVRADQALYRAKENGRNRVELDL